MIRAGSIGIRATPELAASHGALERWNGRHGVGNLNAWHAMEQAIGLASRHGIGALALAHTTHWMRAGSPDGRRPRPGTSACAGRIRCRTCPVGFGRDPAGEQSDRPRRAAPAGARGVRHGDVAVLLWSAGRVPGAGRAIAGGWRLRLGRAVDAGSGGHRGVAKGPAGGLLERRWAGYDARYDRRDSFGRPGDTPDSHRAGTGDRSAAIFPAIRERLDRGAPRWRWRIESWRRQDRAIPASGPSNFGRSGAAQRGDETRASAAGGAICGGADD